MADENKLKEFNISLDEMSKAGLSLGHRTSKTHPKMKQYISGTKATIHLIDLEKTAEKLAEALSVVRNAVKDKKVLLLVGTKIQAKALVKEIAKECNIHYVNERWLGGTFTNFETIKKRVFYFKDLEKKKQTGELEKYTKRERAKMDDELKALEIKIGGIKEMEKIPDIVFVMDMIKDSLAIKEAKMKGATVIAVADVNVDPSPADYIIPANDDAVSSIKYILTKLKETILNSK